MNALPISNKSSSRADTGQWFRVEASDVLASLRKRVANVLADLGNFSRPADLQHALSLDKTLGRQIFKLASTAEPLGLGGVVPSRVALGRFLDLAGERGIVQEKLTSVWQAFEEFEKLVKTHAGDRVTFNSMVAAASGVDEEWLSADMQHRRNAFRAMSHTMGMQAKTRLQLAVISHSTDGSSYSFARVSGFIGLRTLRTVPRVRVDGMTLSAGKDSVHGTIEPLGLSDELGGHLLTSYSTHPLPSLRLESKDNGGVQTREVMMDHPKIGNTGATNLLFGSVHRSVPRNNEPFRIHVTSVRPVEVLLFDVLSKPGLLPGKPKCEAVLGYHNELSEERMPLEGKFEAERLGSGPAALATPEVPRYAEMLDEVSLKLGWDLDDYIAIRIRVEFPLYRSTVTMNWDQNSE
jgi:hypothetical protein